jgi:hypothetical protein
MRFTDKVICTEALEQAALDPVHPKMGHNFLYFQDIPRSCVTKDSAHPEAGDWPRVPSFSRAKLIVG